jgi:hypothetical protein
MEPKMAKTKRGRAPQGEIVGKSSVMSFRITPATKAGLKKAARESGRSVSQEAEHRLRRDLFDHGSTRTYAVMRVISAAIDKLISFKNPKATWLDDAYLFQQATAAINAAVGLFAPQGNAPTSFDESTKFGSPRQGRFAVEELLREIQIVDPSTPPAKQTAHQRALLMLKSDLGALADRPQIYGKTAEQMRQEHQLGSEFGALMRKAEKSPDRMMPAEKRQLWVIAGQLAKLDEKHIDGTEDKS